MDASEVSFDVWTRADLLADGYTPRDITRAVRFGALRRARRDRYVAANAADALVRAVRVGGRLGCTSLIAAAGGFVLDTKDVHVHVDRGSSRLRSSHDRAVPRRSASPAGLRVHWSPLVEEPRALGVVGLFDAAVQATRCQAPRAAVSTLDSLLHLGLLAEVDLRRIARHLPVRRRFLIDLVDGSAESGPESFIRLLLRHLGLRYETQVKIPGVGRVDFVVEGWLIIECDSRAFHEGWAAQRRDRRRDQAAAALGYATLRPIAEDIFWDPDQVRAAILGLLRRRPRRVPGRSRP